jgi:prevent-host-death family protein
MKSVPIAEFRHEPGRVLDGVAHGESYVITRYHRPVARITPLTDEPAWPRGSDIMKAVRAYRRNAGDVAGFTPEWLAAQRAEDDLEPDPWERAE